MKTFINFFLAIIISMYTVIDVDAKTRNPRPVVKIDTNTDVNGDELVTLDGSGSYDRAEGHIVSYQWKQKSGSPIVTINNADQPIASFTAPDVNTVLVMKLKVTDNGGKTRSKRVLITIKEIVPPPQEPVNQEPIANASSIESTDELSQVGLNGSASSDSDGTIINYSWAQTSGANVTIANSNQASAYFTAPDVNTDAQLTFQLTVTDDKGASSSDSTSVLVKNIPEPNQAPTAVTANNFTVDENTVVTLDGSSSSDSDGTISSYSWFQTAGSPIVAINNPVSSNASFTAPEVTESTNLTFKLMVTDNEGETATDTIMISIQDVPVNQTPIISGIAENSVTEDEYYSFMPEAFDPENDTLTFSVVNLPGWASFDAISGTISGTPIAADIGFYEGITIMVSDGDLSVYLPEFSIDVLAAPVLIPENPLLSEVNSYSISMGTSLDSIIDRGVLGINSDSIVISDLDTADTYYVSIKIFDADGNDLLESSSDIIGYRVYAGTTSDLLYPVAELVGDTSSVFAFNGAVDIGTYYLSIVVFESTGYEGTLSDVLQVNKL